MPTYKSKITICGSDYVISGNDSEEYVQGLAEKLDAEMKQFLEDNPTSSIATAAILIALGYMDELEKTNNSADNMRSQIKDYLEDAAKAKMETEDTKRALAAANRRIEELCAETERLKREIGYTQGQN